MDQAYEMFHEVLVKLFNDIMNIEAKAIITPEFRDITNNDMHIIEVVGLDGGNMSSIAAKLKVTVGSLTTSMNGLVNKGYTERKRGEKDRRVVNIYLTEKGRKAYHHHAEYHEQMTDAVMRQLNEEEIGVLVKTLNGLSEFFYQYEQKEKRN